MRPFFLTTLLDSSKHEPMESATQPARLSKNADTFTKSTYRFFDSLGHHSRVLVIGLVGILLILVASALLMGKREKLASEARNELFLAEKKYEAELKALTPPAPAKTDVKADKD